MGARNVFVRVNSDAAYRAEFIKDPMGVLESEGITLSAKDQKELLSVIDELNSSLPNLGELPRGYEAVISAVEKGGPLGRSDERMLLP